MKRTVRVLLGASYGPAFQSIVYGLRRQKELAVEIVALDADPEHAKFAKHLGCETHIVPRASSRDYMSALIDIVGSTSPTLYVPILDAELETAAKARGALKRLGCTTFVSAPGTVRTILDKRTMYHACEERNIPHGALLSADSKKLPYPLFIKPARGVGSQHAIRIDSPEALSYWTRAIGEYVLQPFIVGTEYTIDIVRVRDHVYGALPRERIETKAGISVAGRTVFDEEVAAFATRAATQFGAEGICNVQCFRETSGKRILFSEINLRPAGASILSIRAGFNIPHVLLKLALGKSPEDLGHHYRRNLHLLYHWKPLFY